jgi:hypothetical protein
MTSTQAVGHCWGYSSGLSTSSNLEVNGKSVPLWTFGVIIASIINTVLFCLFHDFLLLHHGRVTFVLIICIYNMYKGQSPPEALTKFKNS